MRFDGKDVITAFCSDGAVVGELYYFGCSPTGINKAISVGDVRELKSTDVGSDLSFESDKGWSSAILPVEAVKVEMRPYNMDDDLRTLIGREVMYGERVHRIHGYTVEGYGDGMSVKFTLVDEAGQRQIIPAGMLVNNGIGVEVV